MQSAWGCAPVAVTISPCSVHSCTNLNNSAATQELACGKVTNLNPEMFHCDRVSRLPAPHATVALHTVRLRACQQTHSGMQTYVSACAAKRHSATISRNFRTSKWKEKGTVYAAGRHDSSPCTWKQLEVLIRMQPVDIEFSVFTCSNLEGFPCRGGV